MRHIFYQNFIGLSICTFITLCFAILFLAPPFWVIMFAALKCIAEALIAIALKERR
jgi:hypothetical protein